MQKIVGFSFPTLSQTLDTYLCFAFADHDFNTPPQKKKQQKKGKRDTSIVIQLTGLIRTKYQLTPGYTC